MPTLLERAVDQADAQAYGPAAEALLRPLEARFAQLNPEFVDAFYQQLQLDAASAGILGGLDGATLQHLRQRQAEHLHHLVAADTTREALRRRAEAVGSAHALVGAGSSRIVRAQAVYRGLLRAVVDSSPLEPAQRYAVVRLLEQRLQDDVLAQTEAVEAVMEAYWRVLAQPFAAQATPWPDVAQRELQALGALPGVLAALLLRLGEDGTLTVEHSAGPSASEVTGVLQDPATRLSIDAASPRGRGLAALAWRTGQVQSTPDYENDPRLQFWRAQARRLRVRSTFALPISDEAGGSVACLYLYGAYPRQFECDWMREFGRGLQQRWQQNWQRSGAAGAYAMPQRQAHIYREQLFGGGLRLFAQPIVDLQRGTVHSLEALARLRMPDGTLVGPAQFLPLLGHAELDRLFRIGLERLLEWIAAQGPEMDQLGVSINLAPSTLLNPDCAAWVEDGLRRFGVAPQRLDIELLESQEIHSPLQRHQIERLGRLGVRLSMDDLGSGYSSLERLARLPFDVIKIDQGLLASLRTQPLRVLSLVGSLIQMAHDLQREAVVEGLEDDDAIEAVRWLGASLGQGFGICRPMPLPELAGWVRDFRGLAQPAGIRSHLGALAYHWRFMRRLNAPALHGDLGSCPLTAFLRDAAPGDTELARCHARLHAGEDARSAGRQLSDWLVRAITDGR